jgi:hypothetical protein
MSRKLGDIELVEQVGFCPKRTSLLTSAHRQTFGDNPCPQDDTLPQPRNSSVIRLAERRAAASNPVGVGRIIITPRRWLDHSHCLWHCLGIVLLRSFALAFASVSHARFKYPRVLLSPPHQ